MKKKQYKAPYSSSLDYSAYLLDVNGHVGIDDRFSDEVIIRPPSDAKEAVPWEEDEEEEDSEPYKLKNYNPWED